MTNVGPDANPQSSIENPQFQTLWTDYLEGELDDAGIAELQDMLAGDEALLQHAADLYEEHRLLGFLKQPFDLNRFVDDVQATVVRDRDQFLSAVSQEIGLGKSESPSDVVELVNSTTGRLSVARLVGLVAVTAVVLLVGFAIWPEGDDRNQDGPRIVAESDPPVRAVATLLLAENCVWGDRNAFDEGQRLHSQPLELKSGTAVVRFDGGAELVMTGETSLVLQSSGRAELLHGDVVVRAESGAEGFQLKTPASALIDLGTEFSARVDRTGATELHVLDGEVEFFEGQSSGVLSAGKAIRFEGPESLAKPVPLNSESFDELIRQADPKPQPDRMWAYDGFNYEAGMLALEDTTLGKGWTGSWRKRLPAERKAPAKDGSPDQFEIVHGQLNVTWPVPGGRKGMLLFPASGAIYVRHLSRPIDLDRDAVMFFSLIVRETERRPQPGRSRERLRLTFRSSADYFGEAISFGHGPGFQPHVQTGNGISHTSPMVLPAEQTTLWIGKIVSSRLGRDEIYFRVYGEADTLDYAEPATWHVVTRDEKLDAHLDRVLLTSSGRTARIVDELRIGPTWRSVAPMLEGTE